MTDKISQGVTAELVGAYLHARTDRRLGRNERMCGER